MWFAMAIAKHGWAIVCRGLRSAVFVALIVNYSYKSSTLAAFARWILPIRGASMLPWPNNDRFCLVLVLGGVEDSDSQYSSVLLRAQLGTTASRYRLATPNC